MGTGFWNAFCCSLFSCHFDNLWPKREEVGTRVFDNTHVFSELREWFFHDNHESRKHSADSNFHFKNTIIFLFGNQRKLSNEQY